MLVSEVPRAVKFSRYGGSDVLEVVDVDQPHPGPGEVVVRVVAAATNPGEMKIRQGDFADVWPATFPEGQGNDFSGRVAEVGPGGAGFSPGDEVMGFTPRAAQADYVRSASDRLARKPPTLPWEVAAAIPAAGSTAYAAVRAVRPRPGDTVVVSAAAGGAGLGGDGPAGRGGRADDSHPVRLSPRTGARRLRRTGRAPHPGQDRPPPGSRVGDRAHGRSPLARRTRGAPLAGLPRPAAGAEKRL